MLTLHVIYPKTTMRVLQLGKFYPGTGGIEKVMLDIFDGLNANDVSCDILCTNAVAGQASRTYDRNGGKIMCVKAQAKKFATMLSPQMITMLRRIRRQYDIIHVHHPDPMAALSLWLSAYKGKVVVHWHSDIQKQKQMLRAYLPLQNWLLRRADIIVGTTPVYISQSPHLARFQDKCTYVPIGIDEIKPDAAAVKRIKQRYAGRKIVFSLGRLVHYKGYRYLIEAAEHLTDDYVVLIGGSGLLRDELEKQIEENGLRERVKLLGRVADADLPGYYGACDVYCLSSIMKTEAFAIVQVEAMSCGKPVVATNIPASGVPWVNADGVSGLNVDVMNGKALADAIIKITQDSRLYDKLAAGARDRFSSLFRKEKMIERYIGIYNRLLS